MARDGIEPSTRGLRELGRIADGDTAAELTDNMRTGSVDEFEREQEQASPVFQLVLRASF